MKTNVLYFIFWFFTTGCVCLSWSSNVNSVFSSKTISNAMSSRIAQAVSEGISMAMSYCSKEFRWRRWNCPQSAFSRRTTHTLTKEIAYTRAVMSAAIVHSIARNCSHENHKTCNCNLLSPSEALRQEMKRMEKIPLPKIKKSSILKTESAYQTLRKEFPAFESMKDEIDVVWSWGGCSDDPGFGEEESKKLFADHEKGSDVQAFIEKHNNRIGRQIVKETMVRRCRCHGVSGSCSHQTCWMQVAPFRDIAKALKEKYKKAIRISFEQARGARTIGNSASLNLHKKLGPIEHRQLVYLDQSPDYCVPNISTGWPGTKGRTCSRPAPNSTDHEEKKSCRKLCRTCGYRVKRQKKKITTRCNCSFQWCCEVKCEMCVETVEEHFCI